MQQSGSQFFQARNIARQAGFDDAAAKIFGDVRRADDALEGIEFTLAHEPHGHATIVRDEEPRLYAVKTKAAPFWKSVVIFYTCDATHVYLEDIILASDDGVELG